MSSINLQLLCSFAIISVLSSLVSSQYGSGKPPAGAPAPTYGAPPSSPSSSYGAPPSPPSSSYGAPPSPPSSSYGVPQEGSEPEPFNFNYQVKDDTTGSDFGHKADSDGKKVQGEYNVNLPDGRKQIVTYTADENGFQADVKYEGEAIPGPSGPSPSAGGRPSAPGGGGAAGYPSPSFKPPPPPSTGGGANGNFPSGYPSGGGAGPVKGSGGFGGYRK